MPTIDSVVPTSPTSVGFTGYGDSGVGWTSTFSGGISGTAFGMTMVEHSGVEGDFTLTATGTIASDGSISGEWIDNYGGVRTGTFTIASGAIHEVLSYTANVTSASKIDATQLDFGFTAPIGSGIEVNVSVTTVDRRGRSTPGP